MIPRTTSSLIGTDGFEREFFENLGNRNFVLLDPGYNWKPNYLGTNLRAH